MKPAPPNLIQADSDAEDEEDEEYEEPPPAPVPMGLPVLSSAPALLSPLSPVADMRAYAASSPSRVVRGISMRTGGTDRRTKADIYDDIQIAEGLTPHGKPCLSRTARCARSPRYRLPNGSNRRHRPPLSLPNLFSSPEFHLRLGWKIGVYNFHG